MADTQVSELVSWHASVTLPPNPTSPGSARQLLRTLSREWGVGEPESAELLLTEVVTSVVLHARTTMTVDVVGSKSGMRIAVTDCSSAQLAPQQVGGSAEHGRGLLLLGRLADRWGCTREDPAGADDCKTVWFEVSGQDADDADDDAFHLAFDIEGIEPL